MDFNPSNLPLDFEKGFTLPFDLKTGMSAAVDTGKRHLADMKGMFADAAAEASRTRTELGLYERADETNPGEAEE